MSKESQNPESRFESVIDALRDTTIVTGPDEQFRHRMLARLNEENLSSVSAHRPLAERSSVMPRIALLAASLVLVVGLTAWVTSSGSHAGAAFANMLQKIDEARTVTYKTRVQVHGMDQPMEGTTMLLAPDWVREEDFGSKDSGTTIYVYNLKDHKSLALRPDKKEARLTTTDGNAGRYQNIIERLRAIPGESLAKAEGTEKIDGKDTRKFHCDHPSGHYLIWLAKENDLPVKVVIQQAPAGSKDYVTYTLTDFRWDVPLDESLFSLNVPDGYKLESEESVPSLLDPKYFIEAMHIYVHLNHDEFPDEYNALTPVSILKFVDEASIPAEKRKDYLRQKMNEALGHPNAQNLSQEEIEKASRENARRFAAASAFLEVLPQTQEWHYVGKGAKAGQADRIVAWWAPKNGDGNATVLYGDFHLDIRSKAGLPVEAK